MDKGAFVSRKSGSYVFLPMIDLLGIVKENPLQDLFEASRALETKMAALAAGIAVPEDLATMRKALEEMEKDINQQGNGILDTDNFHLSVYKVSKNVILYKIGVMLQGLMHESRGNTLGMASRGAQSLLDHREIYEVIKNRNSKLSESLMDEHLCQIQKTQAILSEKQDV